jgi:hypothetical protein
MISTIEQAAMGVRGDRASQIWSAPLVIETFCQMLRVYLDAEPAATAN